MAADIDIVERLTVDAAYVVTSKRSALRQIGVDCREATDIISALRDENNALRSRIEELKRERDEAIDQIAKDCDRSYCRSLDQFMKTECLGWEAKVRTGVFGKPEYEAHRKGNELMGEHRGLARALKALRALGKERT